MIGKLIQKEMINQRIYLSYLARIESVKKILELDRNKVDPPNKKKFYLIKPSIDNIKKNMALQNLKKKKSKFR